MGGDYNLVGINSDAEDYSGLDYGNAASLGGTLYLKTPIGVFKNLIDSS